MPRHCLSELDGNRLLYVEFQKKAALGVLPMQEGGAGRERRGPANGSTAGACSANVIEHDEKHQPYIKQPLRHSALVGHGETFSIGLKAGTSCSRMTICVLAHACMCASWGKGGGVRVPDIVRCAITLP